MRVGFACAVRHGPYKMYCYTQPVNDYFNRKGTRHNPPLLYHLGHDPSENENVAKHHPEVTRQPEAIAEAHRKTVEPVPSQLELRQAAPMRGSGLPPEIDEGIASGFFGATNDVSHGAHDE